MSARRLLLDAGNTRLKWAVVENGAWRGQGRADYADLPDVARPWGPVTDCVIASVAGAPHEAQISSFLSALGLTPKWLTAEAQFRDVKNTYANPQQLGVDRWMGLIAARQRTHDAALVVSVGTAMTVDALSPEGTFLGGVIVPGIALMQQALRQGTARVTELAGSWQAFPRTTADAVESGIVAALCGAIQVQHARLAERVGMAPHCFLTGGGAPRLLPHLSLSAELVPALVLEGIDLMAKEDAAR